MREEDTLASSRYQSPPSGATSSDSSGPSSGPRKHTCGSAEDIARIVTSPWYGYPLCEPRRFTCTEDLQAVGTAGTLHLQMQLAVESFVVRPCGMRFRA